jgi:hypothetical protein
MKSGKSERKKRKVIVEKKWKKSGNLWKKERF